MKKTTYISGFKHRGFVNWIKIVFLTSLFSILYLQIASAAKSTEYAKIYDDPAVEIMVKKSRLPSGYHYYYTGRSNLPYAVIGIDSNYSLTSKYWHKIESEDQILKKIAHLMPVGKTGVTFAHIRTSENHNIGLWFSEYKHTIIKLEPNKSIKVFSPYRSNEKV